MTGLAAQAKGRGTRKAQRPSRRQQAADRALQVCNACSLDNRAVGLAEKLRVSVLRDENSASKLCQLLTNVPQHAQVLLRIVGWYLLQTSHVSGHGIWDIIIGRHLKSSRIKLGLSEGCWHALRRQIIVLHGQSTTFANCLQLPPVPLWCSDRGAAVQHIWTTGLHGTVQTLESTCGSRWGALPCPRCFLLLALCLR